VADRGPADVPPGYAPVSGRSAFTDLIGPFHQKVVDGRLHRGFRVESRHTNQLGIAHGGMLLSFADTLLGAALRHDLGHSRPAVTVKLSADLITAVRRGAWVEGSAAVSRAGRNLVFVRGRVWSGKRTVLTAEAVFQLLAARKQVD